MSEWEYVEVKTGGSRLTTSQKKMKKKVGKKFVEKRYSADSLWPHDL